MPEAEAVCVHPVAYEGPCSTCGGPTTYHEHYREDQCGRRHHPYRGAPVLCGHGREDHAIVNGVLTCLRCSIEDGRGKAGWHAFDSGERVGATT